MDFKQLAQGALFLTKLPANLMWGSSDIPIRTECSWEEEKDDILEKNKNNRFFVGRREE